MTYVRTAWNRRSWWTAALALAAAACGDDDGGTTAPTPTIGVVVASPTLAVTAGQSGTAAVTVSRGGGYTGAVNLTVEGTIPAGTATANPASLAGGVTASTITVATGSATPAGTYNLTVRAAGTGAVAAVTAPLTVTVTAPAPAAGFTIAPAAALTVTQGAAAQNATINITRTGGFAGAVTLATAGTIPAGLTVTPAAATTGNSATVAVGATSAVAPGTYPITINATGAGVTGTQTTTLNVTVQAAAAAGDFTVSAANVSVQQGASAQNAVVTITRTGGYTGGVTLTTSAAPAGLTIAAPTVPVTEGTANIAVTAGNGSAPGTYPVTVTATGAGITGAKTTTFTVTVTPPVTVGNYTLGTTGNVTVQQGASATTTLNVTRTGGFAGGVQVAATGAPAGVTVTVAPNPVTANTATVTVAATGTAATGTATVTLTGTSAGLANQTTTLTVNVTPASTGGGAVGLSFCAAEAPIWVGYQSAGGAWQRATLGANNQAQISISGRGALAYVVQAGTGAAASYTTNVVYGTAAELNTYGTNLCGNVAGGKSVTGTLAGVGATDQASVSLGDASASVTGSTFRIDEVQPGPRDLIAVRSSIDLATFSIAPNRVIVRRNQNIANGGTIPVLDFNNTTEAFAPASAQLTVNGLGANEVAIPFVALQTANGGGAPFFTGISGVIGGGTGPQTYYGLPADRLVAGDLHMATVIAFPRSGQSFDQTQGRIVAEFFRTVSNRSVTLGPSLTAPTVTSSNSPYPRPRVQLARQAEYGDAFAATFSQDGATSRSVAIIALASYLQGASTWDLTVPDFTGAPGFDATWMLRTGTQTEWIVTASGGSGIVQIGQVPVEGSRFLAAIRSGTLTTTARAMGFAVRQPLASRAASVDGVRRATARAAALAGVAVRAHR